MVEEDAVSCGEGCARIHRRKKPDIVLATVVPSSEFTGGVDTLKV